MSWESAEVVEVRVASRRTVSPRPQASIARAESTSPTTPETNFEQP